MYQSKLVNLIHVRNLDRCAMCTSQVLWGASVLHRARQIYNYRFRDISEFISLALPVSVCVGSTARQSANLSVIILPNPVQRVRAPQGEGRWGFEILLIGLNSRARRFLGRSERCMMYLIVSARVASGLLHSASLAHTRWSQQRKELMHCMDLSLITCRKECRLL